MYISRTLRGAFSRDEQDLSLCVGRNLPVACVFRGLRSRVVTPLSTTNRAVADLHLLPALCSSCRAVRGRFGCNVVVEHICPSRLRVLSSECDLRDRADAHRGLAFGLQSRISSSFVIFADPIVPPSAAPVRTPFSAIQFFAIAARASVALSPAPWPSSPCGSQDRRCGFPSARFERYQEVSLCQEFGRSDLVDGRNLRRRQIWPSGIYLLGLFPGAAAAVSPPSAGFFARRSSRPLRRFRPSRVRPCSSRRASAPGIPGFGERFEQFVLHLGRGFASSPRHGIAGICAWAYCATSRRNP